MIVFNVFVLCCVPKENTSSPLQVKYKLCDRTEHAVILGRMDCTVANNWLILEVTFGILEVNPPVLMAKSNENNPSWCAV